MKKWTPVDLIVLIIAITICVTILISILRPFIAPDIVMSPEGARLVAGIITSKIAIISLYIGSKMKGK